jgi:hypothetical protein
VLGDGRSLNLFEADAIPNQGYDAYRTGTLIAGGALCQMASGLAPGVHTSLVDQIVADSGLYDIYYDTYLADGPRPARPGSPVSADPAGAQGALAGAMTCVAGYGVAGRLHAAILAAEGANVAVLDPKHQDLPKAYRTFQHEITDLPKSVAAATALWSICSPTADHLPILRAILERNPGARVLLEKPACLAHEISGLDALLKTHSDARVRVVDQYRHSRVLPELTALINVMEPGAAIDRIRITFSKNRIADISRGRFVDRSYGVLGYEWLHMLAVLRHLLPIDDYAAYISGDLSDTRLHPVYDQRLFVSSVAEDTLITRNGSPCRLELRSSIVSAADPTDDPPADVHSSFLWRPGDSPGAGQRREVTVHAGKTIFTASFDPVAATGGWQLARNHHRVTATRANQVLHDQVIQDSPLHNAIHHAAVALMRDERSGPLDLAPLRRIAAVADQFRCGWQRTA